MEFKTQLYEHQEKAFDKLSKIKVGALYMEMGTGKTRTALELINLRLSAGKINHVLWLCPCNTKINLKNDIMKHIGNMPDIITICGIETLSSSLKWNLKLLELVQKNDVFLIVDESNLVKNPQANRTENITRLAEYCKYKLILNGTPISRNQADLFSQWYILDYRILGYKSFYSFAANHLEYDEYGKIRKALNIDYLTKKIGPYTYQVKLSECVDLLDKTYSTWGYSLTKKQYEHYSNIADNLMFEIDEFKPETIYRLFTGLQNVISGRRVYEDEDKLKSVPFFLNTRDNPRIECLLDRITEAGDEKIIIFCKYTQEIKDIVRILNKDYGEDSAVPFYGEVNSKQRQKNIDKFTNNENTRFFVANKTCAGYGLNLQFCSYVIYYSNDWDFATRAQSEDRVYRIGQTKKVHIVDLCAVDTLDVKILKCLRRKENMVDSFKNEIDKIKDKEDLKSWLNMKTLDGRKYKKAKDAWEELNLEDGY